jgi:hypothetical protein
MGCLGVADGFRGIFAPMGGLVFAFIGIARDLPDGRRPGG